MSVYKYAFLQGTSTINASSPNPCALNPHLHAHTTTIPLVAEADATDEVEVVEDVDVDVVDELVETAGAADAIPGAGLSVTAGSREAALAAGTWLTAGAAGCWPAGTAGAG